MGAIRDITPMLLSHHPTCPVPEEANTFQRDILDTDHLILVPNTLTPKCNINPGTTEMYISRLDTALQGVKNHLNPHLSRHLFIKSMQGEGPHSTTWTQMRKPRLTLLRSCWSIAANF